MVAVGVYKPKWATEDLEGIAWCEARYGFSVRTFVQGRRPMCVGSAQSRSSGLKSLVSLGSVVLLQRALIWILRAMEVEAHGIRQNGWIPGCGAESRTSSRDSCLLDRRKSTRKRVRAPSREPLRSAQNSRVFFFLEFLETVDVCVSIFEYSK